MPWFHRRFDRETYETGYSTMPLAATGPWAGALLAAFLNEHGAAIQEFRVIGNDQASAEIVYRADAELA